MQILLVEDDAEVARFVKKGLQEAGHIVEHVANGRDGLFMAASEPFDLLILDRMLPGGVDGLRIVETLRSQGNKTPVLFLTALGAVDERVKGLKAGGDDYLVKPFSMDELCMRLEVFLRRTRETNRTVYGLGDYSFDAVNLELTHPRGKKSLTPKESDVLRLLCAHPNQVLKREDILRRVWGDDDYFIFRSMDVFISRLRKYLREDPRVQIQHHHGVGFRLQVRN